MSLNPRTPAEEVAEAANVVRTVARNLREGREFFVTEQHRQLDAAVHELAQILDAATPAGGAVAPPVLRSNRAEPRSVANNYSVTHKNRKVFP